MSDQKAVKKTERPDEAQVAAEAAAARERARERAADEHFPRKSGTSSSGSNG